MMNPAFMLATGLAVLGSGLANGEPSSAATSSDHMVVWCNPPPAGPGPEPEPEPAPEPAPEPEPEPEPEG